MTFTRHRMSWTAIHGYPEIASKTLPVALSLSAARKTDRQSVAIRLQIHEDPHSPMTRWTDGGCRCGAARQNKAGGADPAKSAKSIGTLAHVAAKDTEMMSPFGMAAQQAGCPADSRPRPSPPSALAA